MASDERKQTEYIKPYQLQVLKNTLLVRMCMCHTLHYCMAIHKTINVHYKANDQITRCMLSTLDACVECTLIRFTVYKSMHIVLYTLFRKITVIHLFLS